MTLALVDCGSGNLHSVENALRAAGSLDVTVTSDADVVRAADRIVLPGVGAFAHCMASLAALPDMLDALDDAVVRQARPFLGICVGMQLMADEGLEHGTTRGLGWIGGRIAPIAPMPGLKVPHMGWNDVIPAASHPVIVPGEAYFLHSFAFEPDDDAHIAGTTDHGGTRVAAVARDTMIGVQFHPEKSQRFGLQLLERFLGWNP